MKYSFNHLDNKDIPDFTSARKTYAAARKEAHAYFSARGADTRRIGVYRPSLKS